MTDDTVIELAVAQVRRVLSSELRAPSVRAFFGIGARSSRTSRRPTASANDEAARRWEANGLRFATFVPTRRRL